MQITFIFPDLFLSEDFFNYMGGFFGHGIVSLLVTLKKLVTKPILFILLNK
jgi:hypothetical protein